MSEHSIPKMEWLKTHVFIAAWASPILTLIGMLIKRPTKASVDWSRVVISVVVLTCLAVVVTPGIEPQVRTSLGMAGGIGFGVLMVDFIWRRH